MRTAITELFGIDVIFPAAMLGLAAGLLSIVPFLGVAISIVPASA